MSTSQERFVGLQMSPVNFVDEGVEPLFDMLASRYSVNAVMIGTVSWLGLKAGRRVSRALEGWPDHGAQEEEPLMGRLVPRRRGPSTTRGRRSRASARRIRRSRASTSSTTCSPAATERGIRVYADLMEPMFNYLGHGSARNVDVPGLRAGDAGRLPRPRHVGAVPQQPRLPQLARRPRSRTTAATTTFAGVMWCNERRSPIDAALVGLPPHCFCPTCTELAAQEGIDVDRARARRDGDLAPDREPARRPGRRRRAARRVPAHRLRASRGADLGALLGRAQQAARPRALRRASSSATRRSSSGSTSGTATTSTRGARRSGRGPSRRSGPTGSSRSSTSTRRGGIFFDEWAPLLAGIFRDLEPDAVVELAKSILGLDEVHLAEMIGAGFDPDTYVYGQCRETVEALEGRIPVYMGIGVDAPRNRAEQASLHARHRAPQRARDGPWRRRRLHLRACLFGHEPHDPRRSRGRFPRARSILKRKLSSVDNSLLGLVASPAGFHRRWWPEGKGALTVPRGGVVRGAFSWLEPEGVSLHECVRIGCVGRVEGSFAVAIDRRLAGHHPGSEAATSSATPNAPRTPNGGF